MLHPIKRLNCLAFPTYTNERSRSPNERNEPTNWIYRKDWFSHASWALKANEAPCAGLPGLARLEFTMTHKRRKLIRVRKAIISFVHRRFLVEVQKAFSVLLAEISPSEPKNWAFLLHRYVNQSCFPIEQVSNLQYSSSVRDIFCVTYQTLNLKNCSYFWAIPWTTVWAYSAISRNVQLMIESISVQVPLDVGVKNVHLDNILPQMCSYDAFLNFSSESIGDEVKRTRGKLFTRDLSWELAWDRGWRFDTLCPMQLHSLFMGHFQRWVFKGEIKSGLSYRDSKLILSYHRPFFAIS